VGTIGTMVSVTRSIDMSRKYTNKILDMVDEGILDEGQLSRDLLMWMSERDVEEFYNRCIGDLEEEMMEDDE